MTFKFSRETSTPLPKLPYGNVRLKEEEIAFLDQEQMTFSEFTHRNFIQAMNGMKQRKISKIATSTVWIIIGFGVLSIGTISLIPYNLRLIIGTSAMFLIGLGILLTWGAYKAA